MVCYWHNSFDSGLISGINGIFIWLLIEPGVAWFHLHLFGKCHFTHKHSTHWLLSQRCLFSYYLARMRANEVGKPNGIAWCCWYCRPSCKHWKATYWMGHGTICRLDEKYLLHSSCLHHFLLFPLNPFPASALMGESHATLITSSAKCTRTAPIPFRTLAHVVDLFAGLFELLWACAHCTYAVQLNTPNVKPYR